MRSVLLSEDDTILFGSNVNRTLYILYRENKQNFTNMWKEQGKGYWLQFCITLRAVLQEEGYGSKFFPLRKIPISKNYIEKFYMMFVDYLTGDSVTHIHNFVTDVVSVSRFPQLFSYYTDEEASKNNNGFHRLFVEDSCEQTIHKMFLTLPVLLRAVGCLLKVFQSWLEADQCQTIEWKVPHAWQTTGQLLPFDQHLKKCWGHSLLKLLGVKAVEIGWWKTVSKNEWPSPPLRTSPMGKVIAEFRDIDIKVNPIQSEFVTKLTVNNIDSRKLFIELGKVYNFPSEAWLMSFDGRVILMYTFATTRGLYLVDSAAIFHPYSQYMEHFASNAFGPRFWSQSFGAEEIFADLSAHLSDNKPDTQYFTDIINKTSNLLGAALTLNKETRKAIQMNSQFFDSLTSSITWTSPVTMVRLVWNMPLCLNWLELLLFKIFEFERYFLPFCHYPLRKAVVPTVTLIYKILCKEARFLTKLAIMVAEGIYFKECSTGGRCHKARITLTYSLERLLPKMKCFLEGTPYILLDAVLREGWFEYEQDDGECVSIPSDVFSFIDLEGVCVPNVDEQFISNFRSIEYWMSSKGINSCLDPQFFSESVEMLESYQKEQSGIKCSKYHKLFNSFAHHNYNAKIIHNFAYGGIMLEQNEDLTSFRLRLTQHMFSLLQEDGWLREEHEVTFNQMYMQICSLPRNHLSIAKMCDIIGRFEHFGAVYNAMALILADTWEHTIPDQNLLVRLHKAECRAAMADVSAQFSVFIQKQDPLLQQACPASKYFKEAHLAIKRFSRNIPKMDIKDALAYVEALEKEQCSIKVTIDGALSAISNDSKLINPSATNSYQKFLEECEDKRVKLLQLVSNVQFDNTKKCVKSSTIMTNQLFPLHFVLEFSLVEEMAALQKCQEMGNTAAAGRMVELLSLRIVWLQLKFKKWSTESMNPTGPSQGIPFFALRSGIAEIVSCSWINLIPLKIMFRVYLSKFGTTHPFSELSEFMFWQWVNDLLNYTNDVSWLAATDNSLSEFFDELCNTNVDYFAKLLDHCRKAWKVPWFLVDIRGKCQLYSLAHALRIFTLFTYFHRILSLNVLVHCPENHLCLVNNLANLIVEAGVILLDAIRTDSSPMWASALPEIRAIFKNIVSIMTSLGHFLPTRVIFPEILCLEKDWCVGFTVFVKTGDIPSLFMKEFITGELRRNVESCQFDTNPAVKIQKYHCLAGSNDANKKAETTEAKARESPKPKPGNKKKSSFVNKANTKTSANKCKDDNSDEKLKSKNCQKETTDQININSEVKSAKSENMSNDNIEEKISEEIKKKDKEVNNTVTETADIKSKKCDYCDKKEPSPKAFKKCKRCVQEKMKPKRYCSYECQALDWKKRHFQEHSKQKTST